MWHCNNQEFFSTWWRPEDWQMKRRRVRPSSQNNEKYLKKSGVRPPSLHWKNVPGSWFSIVVSCCSLIILIIIIITIVVIVIIIYYYLYIIITFYCCLLLTLIFFIFVMVMVITCEWNELNQTKLNHVQVSSLSSQNLPAPHWLSLKPHNVWVAQPIASSHPVILPTAPPVAHLYHQFPFFFGWPWSVFKTWAITTPNNHPCFFTLSLLWSVFKTWAYI